MHHRLEDLRELRTKQGGARTQLLYQAREKSLWQQLYVFGVQAEKNADQKVSGSMRLGTPFEEELRQAAKFCGGLIGDLLGSLLSF